MKDMVERLRPAAIVGPANLQAIDTRDPKLKTGSGRGSDTIIPGSGTSFTPDRQPKEPKKPHKLRNTLLVTGALGVAGTGAYVATQGEAETSTTTAPVVTTIDIEPTNPSDPVIIPTIPTIPSTTEAPTTTLEPKPTDVIEHRDGYDVLRNGGLLYEVESAPEFGGFELHMKSGQDQYGFKEIAVGVEAPQEALFRNILKTFGAQHPEFIKPEGGVDVEAYKQYLAEHNWVDTVYLPNNITEPQDRVKYPPVIKSAPLTMDFKKPLVLSSGNLGQVDGLDPYSGFYEYYFPTPADDARNLVGITSDGQLFLSYHLLKSSTGEVKNLPLGESLSSYTNNVGSTLSVIAVITHPEVDPQTQWLAATMTYAVPVGRITPEMVPGSGYETLQHIVLPMGDFINPQVGGSELFEKIAS